MKQSEIRSQKLVVKDNGVGAEAAAYHTAES
jgi:hypothetical protein